MNLLLGLVGSIQEGETLRDVDILIYSTALYYDKQLSFRNVFKSDILLTFDDAIIYKYFFFTVHKLSKIMLVLTLFPFLLDNPCVAAPFSNSMAGKIPFI